MNKEVPLVLVQTWITLARQSNDTEAQKRAIQMLKEKIGTTEQIIAYMRKHNIT